MELRPSKWLLTTTVISLNYMWCKYVATTESVIKATKSHFARHGITDMITDNGPQYSSDQFAASTREWESHHTTSSPLHSQSNGKAESAIKSAKNLVKKAKRES